jgi:hypothetical protein
MPTRKTSTKKAGKKSSKASARTTTGAVPPYGDPIRKAVARGDAREMKSVAASARKWLSDVESALAELESAIKRSGA